MLSTGPQPAQTEDYRSATFRLNALIERFRITTDPSAGRIREAFTSLMSILNLLPHFD